MARSSPRSGCGRRSPRERAPGQEPRRRVHQMRRSTDRILTTHVGSLHRAPKILEMLTARDRGETIDRAAFDAAATEAVAGVVRRQVENGVDVVNDGEQSKNSWANYVRD